MNHIPFTDYSLQSPTSNLPWPTIWVLGIEDNYYYNYNHKQNYNQNYT